VSAAEIKQGCRDFGKKVTDGVLDQVNARYNTTYGHGLFQGRTSNCSSAKCPVLCLFDPLDVIFGRRRWLRVELMIYMNWICGCQIKIFFFANS
jgi:hypothetical protein